MPSVIFFFSFPVLGQLCMSKKSLIENFLLLRPILNPRWNKDKQKCQNSGMLQLHGLSCWWFSPVWCASTYPVCLQVDSAKERFTVTLKQSLVGASDAAYLQSLFHDLELAEKLRCVKRTTLPSPVLAADLMLTQQYLLLCYDSVCQHCEL